MRTLMRRHDQLVESANALSTEIIALGGSTGGGSPGIGAGRGRRNDVNHKRFFEGWFRDAFKLAGTPLRIELRTGRNPYDENRKPPVRKRTLGHSKSAPRVKSGGKSKKGVRRQFA